MIYLNGTVVACKNRGIIVESNGVGHFLRVPDNAGFRVGETARIYVFKHATVNSVKQDLSEEYYGFAEEQDRTMFAMMVGVPGIGPKTAIALLSHGTASLMAKIANRDVFGLQAMEGMRPNVAVNLVDHLAHRLSGMQNPNDLRLSKTVEALRALGYRKEQIDHALESVGGSGAEVEEMVADSIRAIGFLSESDRTKA